MARLAVKLLLLDEDDRVLLIHAKDPKTQAECWYPVGGGVEGDESLQAAAAREAYEETGLRDLPTGIHVWTRDHTYEFNGETVDVHEEWLLHRVEHFTPAPAQLSEYETTTILGFRWWTAHELIETAETVFPPQLSNLLPTDVQENESVSDPSIVIRPARLEDGEHVWPLAQAFATSFTPERSAFDATWKQLVEVPGTLLLVAETAAGGIVGYLLGNSHLTFLANGPVAWVEEVMVDENQRQSGIGRLLMEHAERWAESTGAAYLALASRRAGPFYQALGYEDSAVFFKKTLT